ncbi:hypothetical protein [Streptomyces sp. NPDC003032]
MRRTAAHLENLGVQAVIAGSPAGTELADRLTDRLHLPGNAADTADIRRDTGYTGAALLDAGITAPRSIRTARLPDALNWAAFTQASGLVLQHPDPSQAHPGRFCRTAHNITHAWRHLQSCTSQLLVLREHLTGTQFRIHTLTGPGPDGNADHTITSTYIPDRGPALLTLRTDPYADFASDVLRQATGHDPIRDTVLLLTSAQRHPTRQQRHTHVAKIALLPQHDGALDSNLLRTITTLPTVAATTGCTPPPPCAQARPRADSSSLPTTAAPSTKTTR